MRKICPFISPCPLVMIAPKRAFSSFTNSPESTPDGGSTAVAARGARGFLADQGDEVGVFERLEHAAEALGAFGVAWAGVVVQGRLMGE